MMTGLLLVARPADAIGRGVHAFVKEHRGKSISTVVDDVLEVSLWELFLYLFKVMEMRAP